MMEIEMRNKIINVMKMIAEDVEKDARYFDGKAFNGENVATYLGNHGAAIKAVAEAVKEILEANP